MAVWEYEGQMDVWASGVDPEGLRDANGCPGSSF